MWTSESFALEDGAAHHDIEETTLDHKNVQEFQPLLITCVGEDLARQTQMALIGRWPQ